VEQTVAEPEPKAGVITVLQVLTNFLGNFNLNPPVIGDLILEFENTSGVKLPEDYVSFLRLGNGGEGFIGLSSYTILWKLEELQQFNEEYEVSKYAPGLFLIGSNGGGEAFAFDTRDAGLAVVQVPFVGMDIEYAEVLGATFTQFLQRLYEEE